MTDITQIPTAHNVTHLYDLYKADVLTRNLGGVIPEQDLFKKRDAFKKLYAEVEHIKRYAK